MCRRLLKAKTQNVRVWRKESFIDREGTDREKMGELMVPQIHLACRTRLRVFKGLGEQVCGNAGGVSFNCNMPLQ